MITTLITILHVFVSLFLVLVVLLQTSSADMGTSFGGGAGSVLGASGGNKFMNRLTGVVATVFMLTSIALTMMGSGTSGGSVVSDLKEPAEQSAPADEPAETPAEAPPEEHFEGDGHDHSAHEGEAPAEEHFEGDGHDHGAHADEAPAEQPAP